MLPASLHWPQLEPEIGTIFGFLPADSNDLAEEKYFLSLPRHRLISAQDSCPVAGLAGKGFCRLEV